MKMFITIIIIISSSITAGQEGPNQDILKLQKILQGEKYKYIRNEILTMADQFKDRDLKTALTQELKSEDHSRRCKAAFALELLGDRSGVPVLIAEMNDTSYRPTKMIRSDGKEDQPSQVKQDHYSAALLLGLLGDKRAVPALIEKTKDTEIDYQAAMSLGEIGDKSAIPALKEMLKQTVNNTFSHLFAGYGLAMLGDKEGLKVVIDILDNKQNDWVNRRHAIEALAKLKSKQAIPSLIAALKDENTNIKVSAAEALGNIGDANALPALKEALNDRSVPPVNTSKSVSQAAAEAIKKISPEFYKTQLPNIETEPNKPAVQKSNWTDPEMQKDSLSLMLKFQNALKASDWTTALSYCTDVIRNNAAKYPSLEAYFKDMLPIKEIASVSEFKPFVGGGRGNQITYFIYFIEVKDPDYQKALNWQISTVKKDSEWQIDFSSTPLSSWKEKAIKR